MNRDPRMGMSRARRHRHVRDSRWVVEQPGDPPRALVRCRATRGPGCSEQSLHRRPRCTYEREHLRPVSDPGAAADPVLHLAITQAEAACGRTIDQAVVAAREVPDEVVGNHVGQHCRVACRWSPGSGPRRSEDWAFGDGSCGVTPSVRGPQPGSGAPQPGPGAAARSGGRSQVLCAGPGPRREFDRAAGFSPVAQVHRPAVEHDLAT